MKRQVRRTYRVGSGQRTVVVRNDGETTTAEVDGIAGALDVRLLRELSGGAELVLAPGGRAVVVRDGDRVHVAYGGRTYVLELVDERVGDHAHAVDEDEAFAASPMTGVVLSMNAEAGGAAAEGETLFVIEAMKMEFAVTAPRDVVVDRVDAAVGDRVEIGQVLVTYAEEASE